MALSTAATGFALPGLAPIRYKSKTSNFELKRNNHHHEEPKIRNQLRIPPKLHSFDSKKLGLHIKHQPFEAISSTRQLSRQNFSSFICAAAFAMRGAGAQTLPSVEKPKTTNTAPRQDKTPSTPRLDDRGPTLPPWFGGGGGGGGGGGLPSSGGFFLFGFLLLLSYLKEEEEKLLKKKKKINREEVQGEA